jgi:hypothetical protein
MNKSDFTYLLQEPCSISQEQSKTIESIIETYPYFQAAHVLNLKALKKQHSFKYNDMLKKTAAYTTNRTILFDFITADTLDIVKKNEDDENLVNEVEVIGLEVIEDIQPDTIAVQTKPKKPILESLQIGEPLDFDKAEKHSFNEWLQLTSFKPIQRVEFVDPKLVKKKSEIFELIDKFIENKPKIKPVKSGAAIDISTEGSIENESLMTETLARVYLEQKKYDKAIKAFKILSLKYPEKSGFFADRIKAVQFLQKNNS